MARPRSVSTYERTPLSHGWELAEVAPGSLLDPAELAAAEPEWLPAQERGTAAAILRDAGRWELGSARALDDRDFWYRCRFSTPAGPPGSRSYLCLEGLASVADVWLNGAPLLRSENMHVAHALDVTALLHREPESDPERNNELCILFHSLTQLLQARRPRPRWRTRLIGAQQLRWYRTTMLGRMPGWCPAVAPVGPWRPVFLEQRRSVDGVQVRLALDPEAGTVSATLRLQPLTPARAEAAQLVVGGVPTPLQIIDRESADGGLLLTGQVRVRDAKLWWPHTHGQQPLYAAHAYLQLGEETLAFDFGQLGFRRIELDTGDGDDFELRVNGVPVFCRGACWTPLDVVRLAASPESYRDALLAARAAGLNMLRLPGNLLYEDRVFHELCDELGVLVWQDFLFANLDYPIADPDFAQSVRAEATQLLEGLAHSPSLALLCGGSEVEQQAAMMGVDRSQWSSALFHELLPSLCRTLCPEVPYWPATPSGGELPFQVNRGVSHYYGVGAYLRPPDDARRSEVRFAAECLAFANIPEQSSLLAAFGSTTPAVHHPQWKARVPRDVGAGWDFDDVRDHYLRELYGVDPVRLRGSDPARYLLLGRAVCGEVMAGAFAEWRRRRSTCRGALVWLYRDVWPGAGWGLLDALGTPKSVYYYLKRTLQPLALLLTDEGLNGLYAHLLNETAQARELTLVATLYRDGEVQVAEGRTALSLPARGALEVPISRLLPHFLDITYAYRFGPPSHDVVVVRMLDEQTGQACATAFYFPLGLGSLGHGELGLSALAHPHPDGSYSLAVQTRRFAQSVAVCAGGFSLDDNYFHLEPGGRRVLTLRPQRPGVALDATITAVNTLAPEALVRLAEAQDTLSAEAPP